MFGLSRLYQERVFHTNPKIMQSRHVNLRRTGFTLSASSGFAYAKPVSIYARKLRFIRNKFFFFFFCRAIVRLTLYFCTPGSGVYHAVYLDQVGRNEISRKLAALLGVHQSQIHEIYMQGPNGIRVLITDEVVNNIKDESMFSIEILKGS